MLTELENLKQIVFNPTEFQVNDTSIPFMRIEIPFERVDLLAWMNAQTLYPKVYWQSNGESIAAIGSLYSMNEPPTFLEGSPARFYGGADFLKRQRASWDGIPERRYMLPRIELIEREGQTVLAINAKEQEEINQGIYAVEWELSSLGCFTQKPTQRIDTPHFEQWEKSVNQGLALIKKKELEKVVLARRSEFIFEAPINPFELLHALPNTPNRFVFQYEPGCAFIGTSPENLFRRKGRTISTAAIAGTRPLGEKWKKELTSCPKEMYECLVVKEQIEKVLTPLCTDLQVDKMPQVLETSTVQHLIYHFSGTLREGVSDRDVIQALSPTPAVGGLPREGALEFILEEEGFDRGWYAAPVGYISRHATNLLVGIRSALVSNQSLYLFSGAGIVEGSHPKREWKELEHKISQFIRW